MKACFLLQRWLLFRSRRMSTLSFSCSLPFCCFPVIIRNSFEVLQLVLLAVNLVFRPLALCAAVGCEPFTL